MTSPMRMLTFTVLCLALLTTLAASAQDAQSSSPQPAAATPPLYQGNPQDQSQSGSPTWTPDTNPPTGALQLGVGWLAGDHNFLSPRVRITELVDSQPPLQGITHDDLESTTGIAGGVDIDRNWRRDLFQLRYYGGGLFYTNSILNSSFHQLEFTNTLTFGRFSLMLSDQFGYSPESGLAGFGSGGLGGLGGIGGSLQGVYNSAFGTLHPGLSPSQSILTTGSPRYNNTGLGQLQWQPSARTSITAYGSYGIIRFIDPGFTNADQIAANLGYNRVLTAHDTLSAAYDFGRFVFQGGGSSIVTHSGQLGYTRKVTARVTWTTLGGPQVTQLNQPGFSIQKIRWSLRSSLRYQRARTGLSIHYNHGINGGSGVLLGASGDSVSGSVQHQFTRHWSADVNGGYSRNRGLTTNTGYDSVYTSANLRRVLGHHATLSLTYSLQHQISSGVCVGPQCDLTRHVGGIVLDWQFRPIRLY